MNFELAADLYTAGFPLKKSTPNSTNYFGGEATGSTVYDYPTLNELIEACGLEFSSLQRSDTNESVEPIWHALSRPIWSEFIGKTPEEAVAKLWLALNPKHETSL